MYHEPVEKIAIKFGGQNAGNANQPIADCIVTKNESIDPASVSLQRKN
jgi:hypothetical protein